MVFLKNCRFIFFILAILCIDQIASAQYYFNKNKVQYQDFHFKTLETLHFEIYFYDGGENLAEFASKYAEDFFTKIADDLKVEIKDKIPVIIYNAPNQFEQTNITLDIIEESVGGFSELFKNRVVVPFNGSYKEFQHVIEHEITHIFEFEMFYRSQFASLLTLITEFQIPLWCMEGFSEFMSQEAQVEISSEMFMRDLILNNHFVPLDQLSDEMGYINYRIGEEFYRYVSQTYGRKKIFEFLHELKNKKNLESTFKVSFGLSVSEFSKKFEESLKIKYWPQITKDSNFTKAARLLTDHQKDASIYNTAPAISPSGNKIAFISDRNGYADIYVISAIDGKVLKHLLKGERTGGFESVHTLQGGIAWSQDERFIIFVAKSHGKDNIVVVEYPSGKVKKRMSYNLDGIYSPSISPDNQKVCFIGLKNGYADIYFTELKDGALTRVTYDYYDDRDPIFSPEGKRIVFVSDRPEIETWQPGAYGLFQISLNLPSNDKFNTVNGNQSFSRALQIERFPNIPRSQYLSKPVFATDSQIIFTAADSSYNIYLYSTTEKKITNRTDFSGGVYYPTISKDNTRLAFSYFKNVGWDIAVIENPITTIPVSANESIPIVKDIGQTYEPLGVDQSKVRPYKFTLTPDYAIGQAAYATGGIGISGQIEISLSDILGNHQFYLVTDLYQDISSSEILFNYWYLPKRTDWAFIFTQYFEYPNVSNYFIHLRRNRGLGVLASYPFDKFTRLEFGTIGYLSENEQYRLFDQYGSWYLINNYREHILLTDEAFVFDNTVWNDWGPYRGTRIRMESYQSSVLSSRKFYTGYLDFRNYLKLAQRYSFATLLYGLSSFGPNREIYSIGGEVVRGYQENEFYNNSGSKLALISFELRHPFIDQLKIAFPLPIELSNIRGVTFLDAGAIFNDSTVLYRKGEGFKDLKVGIGAGIRIQISYFLLKLDFAKPLSVTENKGWKVHFGLGTDF